MQFETVPVHDIPRRRGGNGRLMSQRSTDIIAAAADLPAGHALIVACETAKDAHVLQVSGTNLGGVLRRAGLRTMRRGTTVYITRRADENGR